MKRPWLTLGASALVLTGIGLGAGAFASSSEKATIAKAEREATAAEQLLGQGKTDDAVARLEAAVGLRPQDAGYRALLAQAYLKAGRFASARQTFEDALSLDPNNGRAALSLALAQIGGGDWTGARRTLDAHASQIPARDRGLAVALAGDPAAGVDILSAAARAPDADSKARQNLALALALAGRWPEAKATAAIDLSPDQLDQRLLQWAAFARPNGASDQVAALLGVVPVQDPGQPTRLALNAPASGVSLAAQATPVDAFMPGAPGAPVRAVAAPAPAPVEAAAPAVTALTAAKPAIVFGPRQEIVQQIHEMAAARVVVAIPTKAAIKPAARPVVAAPAAPHPLGVGSFFVQLGAYPSAAVAHDAWGRARSRFAPLRDQAPHGVSANVKGASVYRLSIGGFARPDAARLCERYRASGGTCFVRAGAGDAQASWGGGKLAAK